MEYMKKTSFVDQELSEIFDSKPALSPFDYHGELSKSDMRGLLLGLSAISRKNIRFLTKRKWKHNGILKKGLTGCAINAYIHLCTIATGAGIVEDFCHEDFTKNHICSDRAVYDILSLLEENGLIKISGKKYSHFRRIILTNAHIGSKERFLSLNRTFFHPGEQDYEIFKSLSVGPKSLLLYILYSEQQKADTNGYTYTGKISQLASYMGVKKSTVIQYIKQINEAFSRTIIEPEYDVEDNFVPLQVQGASYDHRIHYDILNLPVIVKRSTMTQNKSFGFWRSFEKWLKKHQFKERTIRGRNLTDPSTYGSSEELISINRKNFHNTLYLAIIECSVKADLAYRIVLNSIRKSGYIDEISIAEISNNLSAVTG